MMQSHPALVQRPRPPVTRRPSGRGPGEQSSGSSVSSGSSTSLAPPTTPAVPDGQFPPAHSHHDYLTSQLPHKSNTHDGHLTSQSSHPPLKLQPALRIDRDLDLDLPSHLTAALELSRSMDRDGRAAAADALDGEATYAGPRWGRRTRRTTTASRDADSVSPDTRGVGQADDVRVDASVSSGRADVDVDAVTTETSNLPPSSPSSAYLDRDWVGALPRQDLEALLFQANAVIQERERDLGIAAAIGQALLQKNISLRRKHEGVMTRLNSDMDLAAQAEAEGQDGVTAQSPSPSQPPQYSPPKQDLDIDAHNTPADDDTPTVTRASIAPADYFGTAMPTSSESLKRIYAPSDEAHTENTPHHYPFTGSVAGFSHMRPSTSGLILSAPQSPGGASSSTTRSPTGSLRRPRRGNGHRHTGSLHTSETQKQLSALSAQNEALLAQLAELQQEAEDAKRQGGKKLRKLNKEIEGLQGELEAATERNVQLEQEGSTAGGLNADGSPRKQVPGWRRRQAIPWGLGSELDGGLPATPARLRTTPLNSPSLTASVHTHGSRSDFRRRSIQLPASLSIGSELSLSGGIDAILHRSGGEEEYSAEQRAVVQRLLAKIKELEQTNNALDSERREREGKMGLALERGVRISDEYEAVLSAHDGVGEGGDDEDAAGEGMPGHSTGASPQSHSARTSPQSQGLSRRRALGNRVQIEGRKTVRTALRRHHDEQRLQQQQQQLLLDGAVPYLSSTDSAQSFSSGLSTASSTGSLSARHGPRRKRSALALGRPRIFITPSMEDLAARRKEQEEGWEDLRANKGQEQPSHLTSPPQTPAQEQAPQRDDPASLGLAHARKILFRRASEEALRKQREREHSAAQNQDMAYRDHSPHRQRRPIPSELERWEENSGTSPASTRVGPWPSRATSRSRREYSRSRSPSPSPSRAPSDAYTHTHSHPQSEASFSQSEASYPSHRHSGSITSLRALSLHPHAHTLASELGTDFEDAQVGEEELGRGHSPALSESMLTVAPAMLSAPPMLRPSLRHQASYESIGGASDAASDIAHLRWPSPERESLELELEPRSQRERERKLIGYGHDSSLTATDRNRDYDYDYDYDDVDARIAHSLAEGHGSLAHPEDDALPLGALRDALEPREEQYSLLTRMSEHAAVRWADDDDYGRPIKESEARALGLAPPTSAQGTHRPRGYLAAALGGAGPLGARRRGLLGWATRGLMGGRPQREEEDAAQTVRGAKLDRHRDCDRELPALMSAEQLEEEERTERLLRAKYHHALRVRGLMRRGHAYDGEEREFERERDGGYGYGQGQSSNSDYGTAPRRRSRSRKPSHDDEDDEGEGEDGAHSDVSSSFEVVGTRSDELALARRRSPVQEKAKAKAKRRPRSKKRRDVAPEPEGDDHPEPEPAHEHEHEHERASAHDRDVPPSPSAPVPSADYWPTAPLARYHPQIVTQRVHLRTTATLHEITAWASLVFVLVVAFLVSASRGEVTPRRILGGQGAGGERERERERSRERSKGRQREA